MNESLADQVYRCLWCGYRFKGARVEVIINGHLNQPTCPKCGHWVRWDGWT